MDPVCQLIPVDGTHSLVTLHNKKPLVIGRSRLTAVEDIKCSRQQVEMFADYAKKEVHIKHLGHHPSRVATKVLHRGDTYILGPMGWFELLEGNYKYHVHFGALHATKAVADLPTESEEPICTDLSYEDEPPRKKSKASTDDSVQRTLLSFVNQEPEAEPHEHNSQSWRQFDSLLLFQYGALVKCSKVAAFDLDNTVIETSSGKKFATGPTDWKIMSGVANKLKSCTEKGYKIVLLSNQLGISKGKPTKEEFKQKVEAIVLKIKIPLLLMAASVKDRFRKPCTGMWDHLIQFENGNVPVDVSSSFYVGDAAGREVNWLPGKKKDFSCTDRKFAANLGIPFFTPEELFLGYPPCKKYHWGAFDPRNLKCTDQDIVTSSAQELVMFVGYPASGKTTFFTKHFETEGYCHVNRDTLGSWQRCVNKCTELLKAGKHVVVDNTNPDRESRSRYIEVVKKFDIPVRCFQFMTSIEHAKHNNRFRELTTKGRDKKKVTDMVFNMYKSKYVAPSLEEGISDIVNIEFTPFFTDNVLEALYHQFLE